MIYTLYFQRDETFGDRIGLAELEHYSILKHFLPLLKNEGTLVRAQHVKRQVDSISKVAESLGEKTLYISFSAPNNEYANLESDKIFIGSIYKKNKTFYSGQVKVAKEVLLRKCLQESLALISSCPNSLRSIQSLHKNIPSIAIPPPLWDHYSKLFKNELNQGSSILETNGDIISNQLAAYQAKFIQHKIPLKRKFHSIFTATKQRKFKLAIEYLFRKGMIHFESTKLETRGIVYTTVIGTNNPFKDYKVLISDFCAAFGSRKEITLIVKMAGKVTEKQKRQMLRYVKSQSCTCSIIIINEHLPQAVYENLIKATHFIINSSCTDEIGNSLLEFMSAGKPLLSPDLSNHSFFTDENTFFTSAYKSENSTFKGQLLKSHQLIIKSPQNYLAMSKASTISMREYCSVAIVSPILHDFLDGIKS